MPSARVEPHPSLSERREPSAFSLAGLWGYVRQITCVLRFFGTGLVVSPVCLVLSKVTRIPHSFGQELIRRLFANWLNFAVRIGVFEITIPEREKLSRIRGSILAPNHPSLLDAVFLLSVVPRTVCIMRANLINDIFLGGAARLAGYVPNDCGSALVRHGVEKITAGENLLIFPEGTRTRGGALNPFKHGFALIATKTGAPIQTIFIEREGRYLSKGVSLFAFARPPFRFRIHLGECVKAAPGETAHELSARLERYFRDHLEDTGSDIRLKSPLS
jgi:1-acyl-sn-glycerol-3-phosphate acyltransferase